MLSRMLLGWPPRSWSTLAALAVGLATALPHVRAADPASTIRIADLKRHVAVLSADSLQGRKAGEAGGQAASAYLATELKRHSRLTPVHGRSWYHEFGPNYRNVLAMLPAAPGPTAQDVIVIGAHYDHVGLGGQGLSEVPYGQIHNGADDNASGTACLLEVLEELASLPPLPRTVIFAFWDAEELGLLGSEDWIAKPPIERERIKLYLNLDMVGRLRHNQVKSAGWRTATGLRLLAAAANSAAQLNLEFLPHVPNDTDHYSFYRKRVPVLHFDTGLHADYHKPSDDAELLNYDGLQRISQFMCALVQQSAANPPAAFVDEPTPPFVAKPPQQPVAPKTRLGLHWKSIDGTAQIVEVTGNSPAAAAGLQPQDRILSFAGWQRGGDDDFHTLAQLLPELPHEITYERPGIPDLQTTRLTPTGSPTRLGISYWSDRTMNGAILVSQVTRWSPADRAGLVAGDYLLRLQDQPLTSTEEFLAALSVEVEQWEFEIERHGQRQTVMVPSHRKLLGVAR